MRALLATIGSVALLVGPHAASAAAVSGDERVVSYVADLTVADDGSVAVREEITYFFADEAHGLQRFIPVRAPYDQTHDRDYPVQDLQVSSPSGAPTQVESETDGDFLDVRIGDPDSDDVRGEQTYVLTYTMPAVVDSLADGSSRLTFDVVGTGWEVPIDDVSVTLNGPAQDLACFTGEDGSSSLCDAQTTATGAAFSASGLDEQEGVTVVAGFPVGALSPVAPLLVDTFSPARAFAVTPTSLGGGAAVLAVGAVGLLALRRRRTVTPTNAPVKELIDVTDVPPGVLGAVVHGGARDGDVVATLLDLAQRGHLRIEEVDDTDWRLERGRSADPVRPAEQRLLETVFATGDVTTLSAVRTTARAGTARTRQLLEDDAVARGLFTARPGQLIGRWVGAAGIVVAVGTGLTVALALWTQAALVGVAVVVVGVAILAVGLFGTRPLTGRGHAARERATEFATTLARPGDPSGFTRLVPYAVALDATSAWTAGARTVQGANVPAPSWYSGRAVDGSTFNVALFAGMMGGFSSSSSDALSAAPPTTSSSSGASGSTYTGSGAGGGGGGSW